MKDQMQICADIPGSLLHLGAHCKAEDMLGFLSTQGQQCRSPVATAKPNKFSVGSYALCNAL